MKALISKDTPKRIRFICCLLSPVSMSQTETNSFSHFSSPSGLRDLHSSSFLTTGCEIKVPSRIEWMSMKKKTIELIFISIFFTIINQKEKKIKGRLMHTRTNIYMYIYLSLSKAIKWNEWVSYCEMRIITKQNIVSSSWTTASDSFPSFPSCLLPLVSIFMFGRMVSQDT